MHRSDEMTLVVERSKYVHEMQILAFSCSASPSSL